ncbi:B-cell receptor CD22-like [Thunnus thynnus]|uniref:B-cell receptor CD22-like n=1 Tax=Thunnus thynnus TaxID=8237 RepID=UPI003528C77C
MMESWILIVLVVMPGVWSQNWKVTFKNQCAIKGTSVVIKCEYSYPSHHDVNSVHWYKALPVSGRWMLFRLSRNFRYVGDYVSDCSLEIKNVQHTDEGRYYFHFVTSYNRWQSRSYAQLSVKELTTVVEPSTVTEGNNVSLTCVSGCPTQTFIVWFRDGQPVTNPAFRARREDAGRYYCAVRGQEKVTSAPVALNVQYAPNNVRLSVSPSGDVIEGSSVTLSCSSDANPPVTQSGYSLYKDGQFVSSGQTHAIAVIQPSHSGRYYCQAWNNISWRGVEFIKSTEINLDVQYRPMNVTVSVDSPNVVEGSSVNLVCSNPANPAADNYTWYQRTDSSSSQLLHVGSGQVLSLPSVEASHTGLYLCKARNRLGETNSTEVLLTVEKKNGSLWFQILSGTGVALFIAFVIILLLFWVKRKTHAKKKAVFDVRSSGKGSNSSSTEDQSNSIYTFPSSPPPGPAAQDFTPPSHRNPNQEHDANTSCEDEVTYSTVTIKPRNPSLPRQMNSNAPQQSWSTAGENDDSVIYATIAKSS